MAAPLALYGVTTSKSSSSSGSSVGDAVPVSLSVSSGVSTSFQLGLNPVQQQIIDVTSLGGEKFKESYYLIYDTQRESLYHFYQDSSVVVYNGNRYSTLPQLAAFFKRLPPTKHAITSIDVQPIVGDNPVSASGCPMLISVSGTVTYGLNNTQTFHQTFVLECDAASGVYHVVLDTFRSIEES